MKNYTIYFELYGKKMKTTVSAESKEKAKDVVRNKIYFHIVEEIKPPPPNDSDVVNDIFGIFGMKNPFDK